MDNYERNVVLTEDHLDALADRFLERQVRERLHVTFEQYLRDPDHYDRLMEHRCMIGQRGGSV